MQEYLSFCRMDEVEGGIMVDENVKVLFDTAAVIFAGMLKNNDVGVRFWLDTQGEINIGFSTKDSKGNVTETNTASIMSEIVIGLKNTKR